MAMAAPPGAARLVYTMYESVEDEVLYMCYCTAISQAEYEECVAEVVVDMQGKFPDVDYNWKYWKEEEMVFRRLFGISKDFPGKERVIITDTAFNSAETRTIAEKHGIDWKSVFDSMGDDEDELPSASTTIHGSSSDDDGNEVEGEGEPHSVSTTIHESRESSDDESDDEDEVSAPVTIHDDFESSDDDEDELPASPISHATPTVPPTTQASSVQASQAPAAPAPVPRPILTPEQRELRDLQTKAARRKAIKDYQERERAKLEANASRARNIGAPLLPLKNGFPQFSVIASFREPNPRNSFAGHCNQNMRKAQAYFKVLLRHGIFHGQFVAWVEPKKACHIENPTMLRLCDEAVEFLRFWDSRQSMMTRNVELRDHFHAWKPWHKGTQSSIYRISLDGPDQRAPPTPTVAEGPVKEAPKGTKPRPKGPVDLDEIDTTGETGRLRMEARAKRPKKSTPRKRKKNKDKVVGTTGEGNVETPSVLGANDTAVASSAEEPLQSQCPTSQEQPPSRKRARDDDHTPLPNGVEQLESRKRPRLEDRDYHQSSPSYQEQPPSRKRARDDDYISLSGEGDEFESRKRPRYDDRRGPRQDVHSRERGYGGYSSRRDRYTGEWDNNWRNDSYYHHGSRW